MFEEFMEYANTRGISFISGNESEVDAEKLRGKYSQKVSTFVPKVDADFAVLTYLPNSSDIIEKHEGIMRRISIDQDVAPSRFWFKHLSHHLEMLKDLGIENFKRTVGHHYINFMSLDVHFNQFQSVLKLWRLHNSKRPLNVVSMRPASNDGFKYSGESEYRLSRPEFWQSYIFMTALLYEYALLDDDIGVLGLISERRIGNPLEIYLPHPMVGEQHDGQRPSFLISQDISHISRELNYMSRLGVDFGAKRVLEIGAGYGRLCEPLLLLGAAQYVIVDISPALIVSEFYLRNALPKERRIFGYRDFESWSIVEEEFLSSDVIFLGAHQIKLLPSKYFDISINILSIMEMSRRSQSFYLLEIARLTTGFFYSKQYLRQENKDDNQVTTRESYTFPDEFTLLDSRLDPAYSRIYQELWHVGGAN